VRSREKSDGGCDRFNRLRGFVMGKETLRENFDTFRVSPKNGNGYGDGYGNGNG
jgi:hypothetical protein